MPAPPQRSVCGKPFERARLAVIDRCDDARVEEMKLTKVLKKRLYKPASSRTSASKSRVPVEITRSPLKPRRAKSAYNKIINSYFLKLERRRNISPGIHSPTNVFSRAQVKIILLIKINLTYRVSIQF